MTRRRPWAPEVELLLAAARGRLDDAARERAGAAVLAGARWDAVVALAKRHGLLPLLHTHVAAGEIEAPPAAADALRHEAARTLHRNLRLSAELVSILRMFADAGLPVVPLKGPVLAESVYGSLGLRAFRDLDILCRTEDLPRVAALFEQRGYRISDMPVETGASASFNDHHVEANSADGRVHVEIHHALLSSRGEAPQDFESLASRLVPGAFMGIEIRTLPVEDELVYLCEHGAAHVWTRLEWIATVAERLRSPALDLALVRQRAREVGAGRRLDAAIGLATALVGDVPLAAPRNRLADTANRAVVRRLRDEPHRILALPWEAFRYQWLTDVGAPSRARRTLHTFLTPASYDLEGLPRVVARSPLRLLARPLGLTRRWWSGDRAAAARGTRQP